MKVLAVDDNQDILNLISLIVESMGHNLELAHDGQQGLELIRSKEYDLVFLDMSMPNLTGLEVIDALVQDGIIKKQRVTLFTASYLGVEDIETDLRKKGVYSILAKPADIDQITDLLEKVASEVKPA